MPELSASLRGCEEPRNSDFFGVALKLPCGDLRARSAEFRQASIEALAGQDRQFAFRDVQPAAVLGRVMKLQFASQPSRLVRWEGGVQRRGGVGVQVVQDNADNLGIR